ncbi:MAG: MFS transporter [Pseudomonadota bacterium]
MNIINKIFSTYKKAYIGLPIQAWYIAVVAFVNYSGAMVHFFLALYLTQKFNFTTAQAGFAVGMWGFGALFGSITGGRLADLIGSYNTLKLCLLGEGINILILGNVSSHSMILAFIFLVGFFHSFGFPSASTAFAQICPKDKQSQGYALLRLAVNLGMSIGPAIGGFLILINYKLIFYIDGLTCISAFFVFTIITIKYPNNLKVKKETNIKGPNITPLKDVYFLKILGLIFFIDLVFAQLFSTLPLYFKNIYHLKENFIGLSISINTIIIVMFEMILISSITKFSKTKVAAIGSFLVCFGYFALPFGHGFIYAISTVLIWTLGEMLAFPTLTALTASIASDNAKGKYMGLYAFTFSLAFMLGPFIGTLIYSKLSPNILWYSCGLIGLFVFIGFHFIKDSNKNNSSTSN